MKTEAQINNRIKALRQFEKELLEEVFDSRHTEQALVEIDTEIGVLEWVLE